MTISKRLYWAAGLVALILLAGAAITLTSRISSAGGGEDDDGPVVAGTLDDGGSLLPQAGISIDAAIAAAQGAAGGDVGEVDLEHFDGTLVFNVDVGDKDVKVDAATGEVLSVDSDD